MQWFSTKNQKNYITKIAKRQYKKFVMIYNTATTIQGIGIFIAFVVLVVFIVQFIYGDDELKQRRKKTILYTLGGIVLLILAPSIINLIIDSLVVSET